MIVIEEQFMGRMLMRTQKLCENAATSHKAGTSRDSYIPLVQTHSPGGVRGGGGSAEMLLCARNQNATHLALLTKNNRKINEH